MKVFEAKRIVLGVTGSIAAYKAVDLASRLTKAGALVDVILTEAASKLVGPISFSSVTGRRAYVDRDLWQVDDHVLHIDLGENNRVFLIAPATANTIAKLAHGLGDNLLTLTALASRTIPVIAPAMDGGMFANPATQDNLKLLSERGFEVWGPAAGRLASGLSGKGRMLEPEQLMGHLRQRLGREGELRGKKVVVTAGGTQEPIDPVRVISNRSSGKQGYALAQAAIDQGAEVVLISGPVSITPPVGALLVKAGTAAEMARQVLTYSESADLLIMAAAVADFRPAHGAGEKIKKGSKSLTAIQVEETADILLEVAARKEHQQTGPKIIVGFAAETEHLLENARGKLEQKGLDLIVANDISRADLGIGAEQNQVSLIWKDGQLQEFPLMAKSEVAEVIIKECAGLLSA
jgi:phosphopantothenoylcysteine decarboxylase/phosphopantothenate--cysteine ligase